MLQKLVCGGRVGYVESIAVPSNGKVLATFSIGTAQDIRLIRVCVAALLEGCGINSQDELDNARLIVGELAGNTVKHAKKGTVIICRPQGMWLEVFIIDKGRGIGQDKLAVMEQSPQPDEAREDGRGLYLAAHASERCMLSFATGARGTTVQVFFPLEENNASL